MRPGVASGSASGTARVHLVQEALEQQVEQRGSSRLHACPVCGRKASPADGIARLSISEASRQGQSSSPLTISVGTVHVAICRRSLQRRAARLVALERHRGALGRVLSQHSQELVEAARVLVAELHAVGVSPRVCADFSQPWASSASAAAWDSETKVARASGIEPLPIPASVSEDARCGHFMPK